MKRIVNINSQTKEEVLISKLQEENRDLKKQITELNQALQLQQTGVSGSYSELPHKKVCFFKVENGKYLTDNGMEITNEMLIKHSHHIGFPWNYIVLE